MTNKLDKPLRDSPDDAPPTGTPAGKPNSVGQHTAGPPVATDASDPRAADEGSPPRRRPKGKTDSSMKNSSTDHHARQDVIGAGLKRIFDEIVEEPIPPEFLELLDQIDRKHEE